MAVYKSITFEGGSLTGTNGFTSASSRASLHTDRPLAGSYSLLMDVNASFAGFNTYEIPSGNQGAIYAAWYQRFYYLPFGDPVMFARLVDGNDNSHGYIGIDSNGYLGFYEGTSTTRTGDAYGPIIPGEIYRFEWSWVANTGERTLSIAVADGSATTILDEAGLTLASPAQFQIGAPNTSGSDHILFVMDELLFDDAGMPTLGALNDPAYKGFVGHIGSNATMRRDTQQAYVTLGYRVEWTHDNDYLTFDPSRYDLIVYHYPTQDLMAATGPWLRELVDAGYPVLVGTNWTGLSNSQTLTSLPGQMRLTGNATGRHPTLNSGGDAISIADNNHAITAAFATGTLTVYANTGHWLALIPPGTHAGVLLALADPGGSYTDHYSLIAVEQGDLDLDNQPVGARVVVSSWMYGNLTASQRPYQNGYTANGLALMEAVAQWLMASPKTGDRVDLRSGVIAGSRIAINVDRATAIRSGIVAGSRISITAQAKVPLTLRTGVIAGSRIAIRAQAEYPVTLRSGVVAGSRITVVAAAPTDALVAARAGVLAGSRIAVRVDVPVHIRAGVIVGTRAQVAVDGTPIDVPGILANLRDLAYYGRGAPPDDAINLAAVTILETASIAAALGSAHHLAAITALEIGAVATLGGAHNLSAVTALETAAVERYAGPGTGLVVGDPAAFDLTRQINELREGDRTHVLLGWAGAEGRSGLIRVMRRMPDEGRDRQDIEPAFQPIPDPALVSKQRGGRQPAVDTGRQVRYFQQLKRQQRQDD